MRKVKDRPRRWAELVGTAAGIFLGLVLLVAAWGKALHPQAFVEQIRLEGLDLIGQAAPVAFLALALEVGLGLALVLGVRRLWVLVPAALMALFFLFLTGRTYWRFEQGLVDETASCGCFGNLVSRTPAEAFRQDLGLVGLPALLMFLGRRAPGRVPRRRLVAVGCATVAVMLLAWRAPNLPLDDLATRLRPGLRVAEICAGSGESVCLDALISELDGGRHLVILSALDEPVFLAALERLNRLALGEVERGLWVLTAAAPEAVARFRWSRAPAFEVREAPEALLRPLYRTLPRAFEVEDGRVVTTFSGLPEEALGTVASDTGPVREGGSAARSGRAEAEGRPSEETG